MSFDSKEEVLRWYESRPRTLTDDFITSIPWGEVRRYPFDRRLIPVLEYMRDVEILTPTPRLWKYSTGPSPTALTIFRALSE